jgi:hypothetical protein
MRKLYKDFKISKAKFAEIKITEIKICCHEKFSKKIPAFVSNFLILPDPNAVINH